MKRIIIGLMASLGLVASISSCKGYFNTEPSNATGTEKALKEASLLQPSLRGLFDGLQGGRSSTSYYGQSFTIIGDVRGDDMQCPTVGSRGNNYYKMDYTRSNITGPWFKIYNTIRRANRLLQMCEKLSQGASASLQKEIANAKAQAQAVRALCYFVTPSRSAMTSSSRTSRRPSPAIPLRIPAMATSASLQLRHFWLACTSTRETPRAIRRHSA